jgi:hypothetical protein
MNLFHTFAPTVYVHTSNNEKKIEIKCAKAVLRIVKDKEEQ